jgi:hypothetical protein
MTDMTAVAEHAQEMTAASALDMPLTKMKAVLSNLWPPMLIAVGLVLTAAWTASLLWLLILAI